MKNHTTSRLILGLALMGAPAVFALEKAAGDPYTEAVNSYIEAAVAQLNAIRGSVDTVTEKSSEDVKSLYAPVYKGLDHCDQLVRRLKGASPKEFDTLKAEFERVRGEMLKQLETARHAI